LLPRNFKDESGYALVEVLAAIVILTIAIIPMVTMFDTGLRSATTSGNYDKARALANSNLEMAKTRSLSEGEGIVCEPEEEDPFHYCGIEVESLDGELLGLMRVTVTVEWGESNSYEVEGVASGASP